jgi:hypothetical protein
MNKRSKDEYIVLFQGVKLSKRQANKVGLGLIFGFFGVIISLIFFGLENKIVVVIICSFFAAVGYFWIGNRIFKT